MASLNTPKAFEKSLLSGDVRKQIEPFVDYCNQNFDQLIRALLKQLTLDQNIKGKLITISALNNTPVTIDTGTTTSPLGILVLKAEQGVKSFSYSTQSNGLTSITFQFDGVIPIQTKSVDNTGGIGLYTVRSGAFGLIGKTVSISGFGEKGFNGEFLCVGAANDNFALILTLGPATTESKSDYTGVAETAKSVTLFVLT